MSTPVSGEVSSGLTCARLLISANKVSQEISPQSTGLLALYVGEREYWRHQFYELFQEKNIWAAIRSADYFSSPSGGAEIDERSIRVIFEFTQWPAEQVDPIDSAQRYTWEELLKLQGDMAGARDYVAAKYRFKANRDALELEPVD